MILASSQSATQDSPYPLAPSRTADKFVMRIPQELYEAIADLARAQYRSTNHEIAQALLSHIEGHRRILTLREILIQRLTPEIGNAVLEGLELIPHFSDTLESYPVRFPDGLREELKGGDSSMREATGRACAEWVLYSKQIEALLARCADADVRFPAPRKQTH